ncbi:hypothetical protein Tco_0876611 [Tanacetum coccineum]|uniref:Uncharacterized protein n=1 Tax=Tanacetum coccineum TaxID=301880 RepID=A0ABQ5BSS7_9ASTR
MHSGDYEANVPKMFKKDDVPRKTRSLTIAEQTVVGELAKSISINEQRTQQRQRSQLTIGRQIENDVADMFSNRLEILRQKKQAVAGEGSSAAHTTFYDTSDTESDATQYSSSSDTTEESANETDDAGNSAFKKSVQARVLKEMKKLLPTHIPIAVSNYVRPCLNTSVLEIKLLNKIYLNKSNDTHTTHQQLYDTIYDSITPDQEVINAQDAEPSFHKRSYDNQDPPNDREGKKRKKQRKDVRQSSSRSSRQNKSLVVHAQDDTSVAIENKIKAIIQKDELTIADLEGAGLEKLKQQYQNDVKLEYQVDQIKAVVLSEAKWNSDEDDISKPRLFKRHKSKNTKPHPSFYNNDFYYLVSMSIKEKYATSLTKHYAARYYIQGIEDMISNRWCKETHRYHFEALKVRRSDDQEYEFSYADLPRLGLNDVEDMYLLQVHDKLHHIPLELVKDFNNELLLFIIIVMIQNKVEDIQLGVESYHQTLTSPNPEMKHLD